MKSRIVLLLLLAMILQSVSLTACGGTAEEITGENVTETETEVKEPSIYDGYDYAGKALRILSSMDDFDSTNAHALIAGSGEMNGEIVNDAVYNRNMVVQEGLNIKLEITPCDWDYTEVTDGISQIVMAGEDIYDVMVNDINGLMRCAQAGQIRSVKKEYLNMDGGWWYTDSMEALELIPDKQFMLLGDYFTDSLGSAHVLYYNKDVILDNYGDSGYLENMIFEGTWTAEKMMQIMEETSVDINGDGAYGEGDLMGFWCMGFGPMIPFISAFDVTYMSEQSGELALDFYNEHSVDVAAAISDICWTNDFTINTPFSYTDERVKFFADRNVVILGYLRLVDMQYMRDVEFDVGISPYPKLNEEQSDYISSLHDTTEVGTVPGTVTDSNMEFIYTCLDFLGRETAASVIPVWYEEALKVKYSSGSEEAQIIDLIRDTIGSPFTIAYSGAMDSFLVWAFLDVLGGNNGGFASNYAKKVTSANTAMQKLVTDFQTALDNGM